jgi:hypothetical protein
MRACGTGICTWMAVSISLVIGTSLALHAQSPTNTGTAATLGWRSVTANVGGARWGYGGVTTVATVPGSDEVIAGVSERGLWSTKNGGLTWTQLGEDGQIKCRPYQILFDPKDPRVFWVSGSYDRGIYKTTNGGQTFQQLGTIEHADGIGVDFTDENRLTLLLGQHERGRSLWSSVSGGRSWHKVEDNLPANVGYTSNPLVLGESLFLIGVSPTPQPGPTVGIYRSSGDIRLWSRVCSFGVTGRPLVAADGTIYWPTPGGLLRGDPKGVRWEKLAGPTATTPVEMTGGALLASGGNQLYVSSDRGATWRKLGPPAPIAPDCLAYSEKTKSVFISKITPEKTPNSIHRLTLP